MRIDDIDIDEYNEEHVTARATLGEIFQVFANSPVVRRNRKGRAAEYTATGKTDGGRTLKIPFDYRDGTARPITAWEEDWMRAKKTTREAARDAAEAAFATRKESDAEGEVVEVAVSKNLSTVVSVRLSEDDLDVIEAAANTRGVKVSTFLREAALATAGDTGWVNARVVAEQIHATEKTVVDLMEALRASVEASKKSSATIPADQENPRSYGCGA